MFCHSTNLSFHLCAVVKLVSFSSQLNYFQFEVCYPNSVLRLNTWGPAQNVELLVRLGK